MASESARDPDPGRPPGPIHERRDSYSKPPVGQGRSKDTVTLAATPTDGYTSVEEAPSNQTGARPAESSGGIREVGASARHSFPP